MSIATLAGGFYGQKKAADDKKRQEQQLQEWLREIQGVKDPSAKSMEVDPEAYDYLGDFDPEMEQIYKQGDSELAGISLDPNTRQAQMDALGSLRDVANSGGLSDLDKAQLAEAQRSTAMQEKGSRDAISQNMAQRGMSGSGMELMSKLMNQQASADRSNMAGMQQAAQAQQARMSALQGMGNLGGSIRAQDYGIAADRAQAQDAINRFNTMNSQSVAGRNTDRNNTAGLRNLETRQGMQNSNVDMRNEAQAYNKGLRQQVYDNKLKKGVMQGASRGALSDMYGKRADDQQRLYAGLGASHDQQHYQRAGILASLFGGMMGGK